MEKRVFYIIVIVLTIGLSVRVEAKPVDKAIAARMAVRVLNKTVVDATPTQLTGCHLFIGADGKGFVLLAADDRVRPVLAYSPDGTFDAGAMPKHVASWIEGYQREIASVVETCAGPSRKVAKEWERWNAGVVQGRDTSVEPLMTSRWHQNHPFNSHCPYDTVLSAPTPVGCAATAMAQIMRYWRWPEVGYGSHSYVWSHYGTLTADFDTTHYRWDLMPDTLSAECSSEEIDAVATLTYQAGVSVEMMYHPEGSGSYSFSTGGLDFPCAENALKTYFRYNPLLQSRHKTDYSDSEWDAMLRAELDAGRPVIYGAIDPNIHAGHGFVIDGYDSLGMFHVNWGWGGRYDAWYAIDSLAPGAGSLGGEPVLCFNGIADAIFGICPAPMPTGHPSTISFVSNDLSLGSVTGSGTYQTYDTVTIAVQAADGCRYMSMASGKHDVPFAFLAIGQDYADTVIFERITGDTIGYCGDNYHEDQPYGESGTLEWGIRIPAVMRQAKALSAVQLYCLAEGDYTLNVYNDETLDGAMPFYTKSFHLDGDQGWRTIELDSTLSFAAEQTVWITLGFTDDTGWAAPIAASTYCGNPDGSWYRFSGSGEGWDIYHPIGGYYTWLIRAVLVNNNGIDDHADGYKENFAYISNGNLIVNGEGTLQVIDLLGRQRFTHEVSSDFRLLTSVFSPGIYVLHLINGDNVKTQRIVID